MARKTGRPALYELMRARGGRQERAEPPPAPEEAPAEPSERPAAAMRVPVGYLLVAGAIALAALVAAYVTGFRRGELAATAPPWQATEPLLRVPPPEPQRTAAAPERPARDAGEPTRSWGPILSDPRTAGKNYFVLIHTQLDKALELARFSRDRGLEAYVVKAKNSSLYRVIVLPGYDRGDRSSEAVVTLEKGIVEVSTAWNLQVNPADKLAYYPERYDG